MTLRGYIILPQGFTLGKVPNKMGKKFIVEPSPQCGHYVLYSNRGIEMYPHPFTQCFFKIYLNVKSVHGPQGGWMSIDINDRGRLHRWVVFYIHVPTDIDMDVPMATHLHLPRPNFAPCPCLEWGLESMFMVANLRLMLRLMTISGKVGEVDDSCRRG